VKNVLSAVKLILGDIAQLQAPVLATAVATVLVPIIAAVAGANITAAELAGWLVLAGSVAATLQKVFSGQAAAARKPAPVPAPVKAAAPATNAYCIIHGTPGTTPLTIEGPFATEADAQTNAAADQKAIPTVPVLVDVLVNPANC
jgi:redox-sensitive bicupin YhaK (pirin superfamily)